MKLFSGFAAILGPGVYFLNLPESNFLIFKQTAPAKNQFRPKFPGVKFVILEKLHHDDSIFWKAPCRLSANRAGIVQLVAT